MIVTTVDDSCIFYRGCTNSIAANPEANNQLSSATVDLHSGGWGVCFIELTGCELEE